MDIAKLDRTQDVFACGCRHGFTIHEGPTDECSDHFGNFCTRCGVLWTKVAHLPRYKPEVRIQR